MTSSTPASPSHPELPPGHHLRRPALEEAEAVAELMCACDLFEIGEAETDADDVRDDWSLPRFDRSRDTWIVVGEDGAVHGYGWIWDKVPHHEMIGDIYSRPGRNRRALPGAAPPSRQAQRAGAGAPGRRGDRSRARSRARRRRRAHDRQHRARVPAAVRRRMTRSLR